MKKFLPFITVCISFSLFSFYPSPAPKPLSHREKTGDKYNPLNPTLYPLYIENTSANPQLHNLLSLENRGCFTNHFKKIIFQYFYKDDLNGFALAAYVGRRKKKDFDSAIIKLSSYTTSCNGHNYDEITQEVYLGNIELVDQKNAIKILKTYIQDSPNCKYIVFKPSVETTTANGVTRKFVIYRIYPLQNLTDICNIKDTSKSSLTLTTVNANPSPPHGGN
jgi:hypothetical protein